MIGRVMKELAISTFVDALNPYINDAKDEIINTARDALESAITGRRTIDEWADIAIKGVDKVKEKVIQQNELQYVGGKLNFAMSTKFSDKVVISFELYFQSKDKKWQKIGAESDMFASNFTLDALEDIKEKGTISFEVE